MRAGRRRAPAAHAPAPAAPQAAEVGRRRPSVCRAAATACTVARGPLASRPACRPRPPAEQHHLPGSCSASGLSSCPFLPPRAAAFGSPPKSQPPARTPGFLKTNRRRRFPRAVGWASAKPAPPEAWKFAGRAPSGTCVLSPAARDAAASARPAPLQSAWRALSLPACHPQSCDAVSGLHGSDSSVELTA